MASFKPTAPSQSRQIDTGSVATEIYMTNGYVKNSYGFNFSVQPHTSPEQRTLEQASLSAHTSQRSARAKPQELGPTDVTFYWFAL